MNPDVISSAQLQAIENDLLQWTGLQPGQTSITPVPNQDTSKSHFDLVNTYDQGSGEGLQPTSNQINGIASINRTWLISNNKDNPGVIHDIDRGSKANDYFMPYWEKVYGIEYVDHEGNTKTGQYINAYHGDTQVAGVTEVYPEGSTISSTGIDYNEPYDSSTATTPVDADPTDSAAPTQMPGGYDVPSADYGPIPGGYDGFQFDDPTVSPGIDGNDLTGLEIIGNEGLGESGAALTPFPIPARKTLGGTVGVQQSPRSLGRSSSNRSLNISTGYPGIPPGFTGVGPGFTGIPPGFTGIPSGYTGVNPLKVNNRVRRTGDLARGSGRFNRTLST